MSTCTQSELFLYIYSAINESARTCSSGSLRFIRPTGGKRVREQTCERVLVPYSSHESASINASGFSCRIRPTSPRELVRAGPCDLFVLRATNESSSIHARGAGSILMRAGYFTKFNRNMHSTHFYFVNICKMHIFIVLHVFIRYNVLNRSLIINWNRGSICTEIYLIN